MGVISGTGMVRSVKGLVGIALGTLLLSAAALGLAAGPGARTAGAAAACPAPEPITFAPPAYVDESRAGGEPVVVTHPDGSLILAAHASTTLLDVPSAGGQTTTSYIEPYRGQTYIYRSSDDGRTWTYIPRTAPPNGLPLSGFSDPELAIDTAGVVYESEINLTNVTVSKSTDSGKSYLLQNPFSLVFADRQWMEADTPGLVYMVANIAGGGSPPNVFQAGHYLYRSTDGGATWPMFTPDSEEGSGLGDIRVDKRDGTVYEMHLDDGKLSLAAFRRARSGDLTPELTTVATGVGMLSHWPALDVDSAGNVYAAWDEDGEGDALRAAGIWFASSSDRGRTWAAPVRVDPDDKTDIWPWIVAGGPGRVAVTWFGTDISLPEHDSETPGAHGWHVRVAHTFAGLGCAGAPPRFAQTTATPEPMHRGVVCQGGTTCPVMLLDRRLGDFFTIAIDTKGHLYAAYSDTRKTGPVALVAVARQTGGPRFDLAAAAAPGAPLVAPGTPAGGPALPPTGPPAFPMAVAGVAVLVVVLKLRVRRVR